MIGALKKAYEYRKWLNGPGHFVLLFRISAWAIVVPALFRAMALPRLMRFLTPPKPTVEFRRQAAEDTAERIRIFVTGILIQDPRNIGRMCLKRSLLLYRFLRLYGIPAFFYLGVTKDKGELIGHSWIEIDGKHFADPMEDIRFSVTFSYPGQGGNKNHSGDKTSLV